MSNVGFNPYAAFKAVRPEATPAPPATPDPTAGAVTEGLKGFRSAMQEAEATAMQTAVSGADPHAMVEALANAELVLNTAVTIRDKVVEAYQELLRMPV